MQPGGESEAPAGQARPKQLAPLVWGVFAFVAAMLITAAAMTDWCRSDEFNLNQLAALLAMAGMIVIAALFGIVGIFRLRRGAGAGALAMALGLLLGAAIAPGVLKPRCDTGPQPVQLPATMDLAFTSPYAGARPSGTGECRSRDRGEPFFQIVSQGRHYESETDWRFGDTNDKFVDISIWPVTPGPEVPAHHLRINIYRLPGEGTEAASADYTDGGGTIQVDTNADGNAGSIAFTDLPAGNIHGSGLPPSITGHLTWSCAASEPTP